MTGALVYVAAMSVKNRILMGLRRLRNGRYLISAVFGMAYLFMMFYRNISHGPRKVRIIFASDSWGTDVGACIVFVILLAVWAWPCGRGGIALSESEIQFLFPAPLRRRDILLYKFLRSQMQIIISTIITSIFVVRGRNVAGMWLFFASISLYMTMVDQLRARLKRAGIGMFVRVLAVVAIFGGASWWAVHTATLKTTFIQALLFFPRFFALAALPNVPIADRLIGTAVVIASGILCFIVAATVDVEFEEGSIDLSRRKANALTRHRDQRAGQWVAFKRIPPPFRLADGGPPEIAIVWKNLIASLRIGMTPIMILVSTMIVLIGQAVFLHDRAVGNVMGGLMLFMCVLVPLIGAGAISQDLRLDIQRIEYLKTFPISGERLVAAEMAAPLVMISIVEMIFMIVTAIFLQTRGADSSLARFATPQAMVAAFMFIIPLCAMLIVMRNAAVLLFPAWTLRSKEEPRGFVATGQRLFVALGNLIVLAVAILPAAVLFVPALLIANRFFSGSPGFLAIATIPSLAVIAAELWIAVKLLGQYFDRFDASNELDRVLS